MSLTTGQIIRALSSFGVTISETQARQICEYLSLLLHWNRRVNLTSLTDPGQILARHFGESLFGAKAAAIGSGDLLDVGSGAGFPALPIALFRSNIRETLLEPNVKKAAFLSEASRVLSLAPRVKVLRSRLEDYDSGEARFDFLTSRAVRVTPPFLDRCRNVLRSAGKLVLWLGREDAASVAKNPGWQWSAATQIPASERRVILCAVPATADVSRETPTSPAARFT